MPPSLFTSLAFPKRALFIAKKRRSFNNVNDKIRQIH